MLQPASLKCEHRGDVPCVDHPHPRLSWALTSERRDERQTAYRVLVAEHEDDLAAERGTLWDSGRVASAESLLVPYAGRPLPAAAELVWSVRVWDRDGEPSDWSAPARFRTGPEAWRAEWIRRDDAYDPGVEAPTDTNRGEERKLMVEPAPYLRRTFAVDGPVRRAVLYATARGVVELSLNGTRVGDAVLSPGWTDYRDADRVRRPRRHRPAARRRERARGDPRRRLVRGLLGSDNKRRAGPLRARARAAVRAAPRARRRRAHGRGHRRELARHDRPHPLLGPADGRALRRARRARRLGGARLRRGGLASGAHAPGDAVALVPERAQPIRVTEEIRPVAVTERAPGVARLRPRAEHGRLGPAAGPGRARARRCSCASPRCSSPTARCTSRTCAARGRSTRTSSSGEGARSTSRASRSTASATSRSPACRRRRRPRGDHRARRAHRHAAHGDVRVLGASSSTSSSATSSGASAATSCRSPPTARSATSGSAGSPTRRSSCPPRR